ncbi:probable rho GTPase-activating protein 12 [Coccomyxa sp. Obi]|nr:probable rho GTPase-activating protein 12 [Coccomyxa sp. Obi]
MRGFGAENTVEALKSRGLGFANFLRDKTAAASESLKQRDWTREQQAISSLKTWGTGAAERVQTATALGLKQAKDGIRSFAGGPLSSICKQEAAQRPCPRIILVCCTHLVTSGLSAEGLFQKDAPDDLVHFLLGAFEEGAGAVLPPPGTSPHVVANVLKRFLLTLPEPLLTYKLLPHFIQAGLESPSRSAIILSELPAPNQNSLQVLLEALHRVAANAAENEMDAHALALSVAPCLAWHPPPHHERRKGYGQARAGDTGSDYADSAAGDSPTNGVRTELSPEENSAVVAALDYLISNFQHLYGGDASPLYNTATHTLE